MHHLVPEQMFSTDEAPAQGISAVKALALASAEGQKIWTITQNNLDLALSSIELGADVESEIRNAVLAGKTATAHEAQIVYGSWVGSGYLLIDPETGAGAYKIAGGGNGGFLIAFMSVLVDVYAVMAASVIMVGLFVAFWATAAIVLTTLSALMAVRSAQQLCSGFSLVVSVFAILIASLVGFLPAPARASVAASSAGFLVPDADRCF